jgi:hypothetical protein
MHLFLIEKFDLDFIENNFELPPFINMKCKLGKIFTNNAFWNLQY